MFERWQTGRKGTGCFRILFPFLLRKYIGQHSPKMSAVWTQGTRWPLQSYLPVDTLRQHSAVENCWRKTLFLLYSAAWPQQTQVSEWHSTLQGQNSEPSSTSLLPQLVLETKKQSLKRLGDCPATSKDSGTGTQLLCLMLRLRSDIPSKARRAPLGIRWKSLRKTENLSSSIIHKDSW